MLLSPILAADAQPQWIGLAIASVTSLLGGGLLVGLLNRGDNKKKDEAQGRKDVAQADAGVKIEEVKANEAEKARYFQALRDNEERRDRDVRDLQAQMGNMRRTFGHEIRNLQQYVTTLQDFYHALWSAATMLAMQCRIMRARLKKMEKESFDEAEFPPVDMEILDPKLLPKFKPTNGWDESPGDGGEKKISGKVTLSPDTQ